MCHPDAMPNRHCPSCRAVVSALRSTFDVAELAPLRRVASPTDRLTDRPSARRIETAVRPAPIDPMLKYCLLATGRSLRQVVDRQLRSSTCDQR